MEDTIELLTSDTPFSKHGQERGTEQTAEIHAATELGQQNVEAVKELESNQ